MDLNELVWENKLDPFMIEQWLENFDTKSDKLEMLELLSKFTYYNEKEISSLLTSSFELLKSYLSLIHLNQKIEISDLNEFVKNNCYFVGTWENPSKSGVHLLYDFRVLNKLPPRIFCNTVKDVPKNAPFVIFLDDIAGSGRQASDFWNLRVIKERKHLTNTKFLYLVLVGNEKGIEYIETKTKIKVLPVVKLDDRYKLFSKSSIYFPDKKKRQKVQKICEKYGKRLYANNPLGFANSQMLIGFHHNIPDNTLPIIWENKNNWDPIFPRFGAVV